MSDYAIASSLYQEWCRKNWEHVWNWSEDRIQWNRQISWQDFIVIKISDIQKELEDCIEEEKDLLNLKSLASNQYVLDFLDEEYVSIQSGLDHCKQRLKFLGQEVDRHKTQGVGQ